MQQTRIKGATERMAFLVIALLSTFLSIAQQVDENKINLNERMPMNPVLRRTILSNGFRYYLVPTRKSSGKIFIRLDVKAYVDEEKTHADVPHLVEHGLFRSEIHSSRVIDFKEFMNTTGITYNAHPGKEFTQYYFETPSDTTKMEAIFRMLSEWISGRKQFSSEAIEAEKDIVIAERVRSGMGSERISFGHSPLIKLRRESISRESKDGVTTIRETSLATIQQFYADWYRPDLAALYVLGDFDTTDVKNRVSRLFESLQKPDHEPTHEKHMELLKKDKYIVQFRGEQNNNASISLKVYFVKAHVIKTTYGDFKESARIELFNAMIENRMKDFNAVSDGQSHSRIRSRVTMSPQGVPHGTFLLNFSATAARGETIEVELKKILTESERINRYGFNETELALAKTQLLSTRLDEPGLRDESRWYSENFLYHEAAPSFELQKALRQKFLNEITVEEMNSTARRWTELTSVIEINAPQSAKPFIPLEKEALAWLKEIRRDRTLAKYEKKEKAEVVVNVDFDSIYHSPDPTPYRRIDFAELGITQLHLGNGVQVVIKSAIGATSDRVYIQGIRPVGTSTFSGANYFSALLTSELIVSSGLGELDMDEFRSYKEKHNLRMSASIDQIATSIQGNAAKEDEEVLFQLAYRYFFKQRLDSISYALKINAVNENSRPDQKVTLDKIASIYSWVFSASNEFTFVITGINDVEKTTGFAAKYFGNLPERATTLPDVYSEMSRHGVTPRQIVVNKELDKYESHVTLIYTGDYTPSARESVKLNLLTDVMEVVLSKRLREKEAGTYQVDSGPGFPTQHSYEVRTSFKCTPAVRERLIDAALDEIGLFQRDGLNPDEFKIIVKNFKERIRISSWDDGNWAHWIAEQYKHGGDFHGAFEMEGMIDSITATDIQIAAQEYLKQNRFSTFSEVPEP